MKVYGGMDVSISVFLTLALVRGQWSASHPSHFTHGGIVQVSIGEEDDVEKRKIELLRDSNSDLSAVQAPVANRCIYSAIPRLAVRVVNNRYYRQRTCR
jgi:hypothetical protein